MKSILLNRGGYAYLTAPADAEKAPDKTATQGKAAHPDKTAAADNASSHPRRSGRRRRSSRPAVDRRVGSVTLNDNSLEYGTLHHRPRRDSIRRSSSSRRSTCRSIRSTTGAPTSPFRIRRLAFTERSRVVRTECRRGVRNGLHRHFALRVRTCDAAFRRRAGRTPEPESCEWRPTPADRRPLGEPEYGGDKTALSAIDSRRAGRPDRRIKLSAAGTLGDIKRRGWTSRRPDISTLR
ncbi:MAG: hypothetical protein ACLRMJ_00035 [Alistipes finegoldii]